MSNRYVLWALLGAVVVGLTYTGTLVGFKSADWASWVQAVGSIVAIVAAFLVADVQFQKSRRENRQVANDDVIRRIKILEGLFTTVLLEANHFHAASVLRGESAVNIDTARLLELRDVFKSIPLLEAPSSELAIYIASLPVRVDELIKCLTALRACEQTRAGQDATERWRGALKHHAESLQSACMRAATEGRNKIAELSEV